MITSVAGPVSAPVHVRSVQPAVEPVPAVTPVTALAEQARRTAQQPAVAEAERAAQAVTSSPPEPVSTQSVLLLRQNGASIAGIAEAYGLSVEAIRKLLHAGRQEEAATDA